MNYQCKSCYKKKNRKEVASTIFLSSSCIACHRLNIKASQEAIRIIQERKKKEQEE